MEFGKIDPKEVHSINFLLPEDGPQNSKVLNGKQQGKAEVFVGCAKWGLPEWVNFLYPAKTKPVNFLREYAKHFNSIELNAAYYKIPAVETVRKWRREVAEEQNKLQLLQQGKTVQQNKDSSIQQRFLFCPKFPESISHYKRLVGAEKTTDEFLTSVIEFEEMLGPCFLQLSDSFGPNSLASLQRYLSALPQDLNVFVELRNEEWFSDPLIRAEVFNLFRLLNKGAVITDVSGRRDILHMEVTVPEVFIRFIGNGADFREHNYARIDAWAERIKLWQDNGLKKAYFFLHQHDERESVRMAIYAIKAFNKVLGTDIPEINLPPGLFI